jgi:hypothetical protein
VSATQLAAVLSTGNITVTPYQDNYWYPATTWQYVATEPTTCMGKAHVFECVHEPKCKCGAITRVMPRTKRG